VLVREASLNWAVVQLDPKDFDHDLNYEFVEVPTTYYGPGGLANLSVWEDRFHLYRAGFDLPTIDLKNEFSMMVRAWPESVIKRESAICHERNLSESFLMQKHLKHLNSSVILDGGWFSSFAKTESAAPEKLYETLGLGFPGLSVPDTFTTHTFLSNMNRDTITSSLHANCFSLSMAVQFAGSKSWLFMDADDFMGTFGAQPSLFMLPQRASSRPFRLYRYRSRPGDVLFFPANWGHAVKTHAGPQLMMNYRILTLDTVSGKPWNFFKALFNVVFLNWKVKADTPAVEAAFQNAKEQDGGVPTFIQSTSQSKLADVCTSLGRPPIADEQLLSILWAL